MGPNDAQMVHSALVIGINIVPMALHGALGYSFNFWGIITMICADVLVKDSRVSDSDKRSKT